MEGDWSSKPENCGFESHRGFHFYNGMVAQLGERLVCNQEVEGSIPSRSTKFVKPIWLSQEEQIPRKNQVASSNLAMGSTKI